ncbi:MAG: UDP-N-acetylmuramoyl-L-alanine--D-glutamate ligase [Opitutales bacterium]
MNFSVEMENRMGRPVGIFGCGASGRAVAAYLKGRAVPYQLYDSRGEAGAKPVFGRNEAFLHDLIVFSPGFSPDHPWIAQASAADCLCLGELDFASCFWNGETVAVTGTNGKTSLTEFLVAALRTSGEEAYAVGNIGLPWTELLQKTSGRRCVAVCEVSSFQAETLRAFSPDAVVWTNFAEDHLDRHHRMDAYFHAKWRLVERGVAGLLILEKSVRAAADTFGRRWPERAHSVDGDAPLPEGLSQTAFSRVPQRRNFALALELWRARGKDEAVLLEAARSFSAPPHRMAEVARIRDVGFWNDSKATNFAAVLAALARFDRPVRWIGGGKSKGGDLASFTGKLRHQINKGYLIGETSRELAILFARYDLPFKSCSTLPEAVESAFEDCADGENIVLSPGFASFDQFESYAHRGDQFEESVSRLLNRRESTETL